jgi:hypothetical protein
MCGVFTHNNSHEYSRKVGSRLQRGEGPLGLCELPKKRADGLATGNIEDNQSRLHTANQLQCQHANDRAH